MVKFAVEFWWKLLLAIFPSKRSSKISFQTSPEVRHQFRRKLRQLHSGNRWCLHFGPLFTEPEIFVCLRLRAFLCKHPLLVHPLLRHPDDLLHPCLRHFVFRPLWVILCSSTRIVTQGILREGFSKRSLATSKPNLLVHVCIYIYAYNLIWWATFRLQTVKKQRERWKK